VFAGEALGVGEQSAKRERTRRLDLQVSVDEVRAQGRQRLLIGDFENLWDAALYDLPV
jgi:hypothetical protein